MLGLKKPTENKLFSAMKDSFDRLYFERSTEFDGWLTNGHWAVKLNLGKLSTEKKVLCQSVKIGEAMNLCDASPREAMMKGVIPKKIGSPVEPTRIMYSDVYGKSLVSRKFNGADVTAYLNEDYFRLIESALSEGQIGFDSRDSGGEGSPVCYRKEKEPVALIMPVRETGENGIPKNETPETIDPVKVAEQVGKVNEVLSGPTVAEQKAAEKPQKPKRAPHAVKVSKAPEMAAYTAESDTQTDAAIPQDPAGGVVEAWRGKLTLNTEKEGIEIRFPGRPPEEIIAAIKASGFFYHWSKKWYRKDNGLADEYRARFCS